MEERELSGAFRRKQKILLLAWSGSLFLIFFLTAAIMMFVSYSVDGTMRYMLEDLAGTQWEDIRMLLVIAALYSLPFFLLLGALMVIERQHIRLIRSLPQEERQMLGCIFREKVTFVRNKSLFGGCEWVQQREKGCEIGIGEVIVLAHHFLYREKWNPFFWQLAAYEDVVWLYQAHSMYQYSNMERCVVSPFFHFYTIVFYTRDRKKHRIFNTEYGKYEYRKILEHSRNVIQGYGKEQKEEARRRFLMWESMDGSIEKARRRRRRRICLTVALVCLLLLTGTGACWGYRQYIQSDAYQYRQLVRAGDQDMEEELYRNAYEKYEQAMAYAQDSREITEKQYQALLELARQNASLSALYPGSVSGTPYEMLIDRFDVEPEIYMEAAQCYLDNENYMAMLDVLRRGCEEKEDERLLRICQDVEAHLWVRSRRDYEDGRLTGLVTFDEAGNEITRISYQKDGSESLRTESTYDGEGKCLEEIYYIDGERLPTEMEKHSYDEKGNLLQTDFCDGNGKPYSRWIFDYDDAGREILQRTIEIDGETGEETEHFSSETQYDADGNKTRYVEKNFEAITWESVAEYDDRGRLLGETRFYCGNYDSRLEYSWQTEKDGGSLCVCLYYNADGDLVRRIETRYDADDRKISETTENPEEGGVYTYEYTYDENGNVTWEKKPEGEFWYAYDENQKLLRMTCYSTSETGSSYENTYVYDAMGNIMKYTRIYSDNEEQEKEEKEYEYTYVYTGDSIIEIP